MKKEYSVKEIADILEVSKPTVQRAIIAAGIEPTTEKSQKRYYDLEKTARIIEKVAPGFDLSAFFQVEQTDSEAEIPIQNDSKQPGQTDSNQKKAVRSDSEPMQTAIEALRAELEAKDRQLAEKDKQLETLQGIVQGQTEAIKGLTESLKAAQALSAGDKLLLMEKEKEVQPDPETETEVYQASEEPEQTAGEQLTGSEERQEEKKGFWARLWHSLTN